MKLLATGESSPIAKTSSPADSNVNEAIRRLRQGDRGSQLTIVHSQAVGQREVFEYEQRRDAQRKRISRDAAEWKRKFDALMDSQAKLRAGTEQIKDKI